MKRSEKVFAVVAMSALAAALLVYTFCFGMMVQEGINLTKQNEALKADNSQLTYLVLNSVRSKLTEFSAENHMTAEEVALMTRALAEAQRCDNCTEIWERSGVHYSSVPLVARFWNDAGDGGYSIVAGREYQTPSTYGTMQKNYDPQFVIYYGGRGGIQYRREANGKLYRRIGANAWMPTEDAKISRELVDGAWTAAMVGDRRR
ncbi:MAG: hypothetical protein UX31_C0001G0069 [Candidatus Nomurabacteria bacterium GW2011_GWA1_46_11]|uniref:Uncharacterized protein n=2 Tax=Parcubacteria group TaxID=1794811 RepID=A0A1F8EYZ4_9BACT|nr:MAG: hypothetical protein UX31_C0001G0069 [Candidatus Nomurabacteria bacterium GW2011_GWA1_46_11]OGN06097.1 MAG: hypothetical protein A2669_01035 [Candidatus Yanofskybacteria bacterium RIFCSPHIGHO2_01_FULL_48_25b]